MCSINPTPLIKHILVTQPYRADMNRLANLYSPNHPVWGKRTVDEREKEYAKELNELYKRYHYEDRYKNFGKEDKSMQETTKSIQVTSMDEDENDTESKRMTSIDKPPTSIDVNRFFQTKMKGPTVTFKPTEKAAWEI